MKSYSELSDLLLCETPTAWVGAALENLELLLVDHAHCEKKAASTALSFMYRYPQHPELLQKLSRLAREELRHFESVLKLITKRGMQYRHLTSARYAQGLSEHVRAHEPAKLIDSLIMGAFIEARSCERFTKLIPHLEGELADFYGSLLKSEARHFKDYLQLAALYSAEPFDDRITLFAQREKELIESPDGEFRFHSGVPVPSG